MTLLHLYMKAKKKDKEKSEATTESVRDLMNRFLSKFTKKKSALPSKLNKYTEHYGKCDISIYLHDYKITDGMIDAAHAKIKDFNMSKFEKDLSSFVKENYDSYVEDQLEDEDPKVSFQSVLNSRKRMQFSFSAANENEIEDTYEIWVLYKSWADEKDSTLCPEAEISVKKDGSYSFDDFHLG